MSQPGSRIGVLLAWIALAAAVVGMLVQIVAPLLRPDIAIIHDALSEYAVGPWGWFNSLGFVGLGVAAAAGGGALQSQNPRIPSIWTLPGIAALLLAALFCLATAWYPMGAPGPWSPLGDAHQSAATLAAGFYLAAMTALSLAFRADPRWRALWRPSALLAIIGIASALLTQAQILRPELSLPFGVVMRGVSLALGLWALLVGARLRQLAWEVSPRSSAAT